MFDSSHNHEHAWAVYQTALDILTDDFSLTSLDHAFLMHCSMLHDVRDHKYPHLSISEEQLTQFIIKST